VTQTGQPRPAESQTLEKLIAIARECFARHGVRQTRMGTVAEAAGIARQTLYASVPSRERLIELAFIARLTELQTAAQERQASNPGGSVGHELVESLVAVLDAVRGDDEFAMYIDALGVVAVVRILVMSPEAHGLVREILRPNYARAVAEGALRSGLSLDEATWWVSNAMTPMALVTNVSSDEFRVIARRFILPGLLRDA
jgi:AcrR family transcriptional regulator